MFRTAIFSAFLTAMVGLGFGIETVFAQGQSVHIQKSYGECVDEAIDAMIQCQADGGGHNECVIEYYRTLNRCLTKNTTQDVQPSTR